MVRSAPLFVVSTNSYLVRERQLYGDHETNLRDDHTDVFLSDHFSITPYGEEMERV
jgi:hypothetical protein